MSDAIDQYKAFRTLLQLLDGKTVADLPPIFRDKLLDGGFDESKLVLEISMSDLSDCIGIHRPRGLA